MKIVSSVPPKNGNPGIVPPWLQVPSSPMPVARVGARAGLAAVVVMLVMLACTSTASARVGYLSHYGEGDGYMYGRTMCGRTVTPTSMFVAALKPEYAHCGMRLTIFCKGRKFHTTVQDRGAYRTDNRLLDAAPGLRRKMGFWGLARIRVERHWI